MQYCFWRAVLDDSTISTIDGSTIRGGYDQATNKIKEKILHLITYLKWNLKSIDLGGEKSIILLFITDFLSATTTLISKKWCVNTVTVQITHIIMARHIREVKDFKKTF